MKKLFLLLIPSLCLADCDMPTAIQTLSPGSHWTLMGNDYSTLNWLDATTPPTKADVLNQISVCQQQVIQDKAQLKTDIFNIKSSTTTTAQKLQALQDLLQQKGLLQ
jgi:hypothetical protein